jgi:hypothetical protein
LPQLRHVFASIEARLLGAKTLLLTDRFVYNFYQALREQSLKNSDNGTNTNGTLGDDIGLVLEK